MGYSTSNAVSLSFLVIKFCASTSRTTPTQQFLYRQKYAYLTCPSFKFSTITKNLIPLEKLAISIIKPLRLHFGACLDQLILWSNLLFLWSFLKNIFGRKITIISPKRLVSKDAPKLENKAVDRNSNSITMLIVGIL